MNLLKKDGKKWSKTVSTHLTIVYTNYQRQIQVQHLLRSQVPYRHKFHQFYRNQVVIKHE